MIGVISASDDKLKAAEVRRAVLRHLFGGQLALAHAALSASLSHLVLLDSGGESRWPQQTRQVSAVGSRPPGLS